MFELFAISLAMSTPQRAKESGPTFLAGRLPSQSRKHVIHFADGHRGISKRQAERLCQHCQAASAPRRSTAAN